MKIALIGPQGSGKGTFAEMIAEKYDFKEISMGKLFRNLAETSDYGKKLKEKYWGKGKLVPDKITFDLIKNMLDGNVVFDGFPRTLNQARILDKEKIKFDAVIYLKVTHKTIVERLAGRRQCRDCGAIYHVKNNPPKKPGMCDKCGGPLYVRSDDDEKIIKERLKTYKKETEPLVKFYSRKKILRKVDAERTIPEIFRDICKVIDRIKK